MSLDDALSRELTPLGLAVLAAQQTGDQILDMRAPAEFAAAHLQGSINISFIRQYATWAATLLVRKRPVMARSEISLDGFYFRVHSPRLRTSTGSPDSAGRALLVVSLSLLARQTCNDRSASVCARMEHHRHGIAAK